MTFSRTFTSWFFRGAFCVIIGIAGLTPLPTPAHATSYPVLSDQTDPVEEAKKPIGPATTDDVDCIMKRAIDNDFSLKVEQNEANVPEEVVSSINPTSKDLSTIDTRRGDLIEAAKSYIGTPYVLGGAAPGGFDCSGLVQYLYRTVLGIEMPRTAAAQGTVGTPVSMSDIIPGDLLYFGSGSGVYHVAIYIGDGVFIHAPRPGSSVKTQDMQYFYPSFAMRVF